MNHIITISIIILAYCSSMNNNSKFLVGKWKCYHKELEDGTTKSSDYSNKVNTNYSCDGLIIEFNSDFSCTYTKGEMTYYFKYCLVLK